MCCQCYGRQPVELAARKEIGQILQASCFVILFDLKSRYPGQVTQSNDLRAGHFTSPGPHPGEIQIHQPNSTWINGTAHAVVPGH